MIYVYTYHINPDRPDSLRMQVNITGEQIEQFKTLVNRAMNTWDRAPAELKEFADMVTEGKILQDYSAQEK